MKCVMETQSKLLVLLGWVHACDLLVKVELVSSRTGRASSRRWPLLLLMPTVAETGFPFYYPFLPLPLVPGITPPLTVTSPFMKRDPSGGGKAQLKEF